MKIKFNVLLAAGLTLGALTAVKLSQNHSSEDLKVAKADGVETYIPMEASFFKDWTDAAGSFAGTDARFWGENYSFEALDTFFRGESAEGWTGTLTSRTWKQSTQYVYFQLGGARDFDHGDDGHAHLVFHCGNHTYDFYNNTFVENPMTLRYFKVPDDVFAELTATSDDFDMYVEIVDPVGYGYGFVNLGYFHVNQTLESTGNAMRYFLNHMSTDSREWEVNKRREIMNTYFTNEAQREVFFADAGDISDSFDTNADFVNHWYFDHNYFNGDYGPEKHFDKAIGTDTFRPEAATNMPFNNNGGFFRGWYEGSVDAGFVASDGLRYRFVSRPFTLTGNGIISIKMAGKASLHVIDATVQNTAGQAADLAWIDNRAMQMDGDAVNMAASGFNTTAMVNHVINLEAYVGRKIQLAIADIDTSGWSACYFDELVTNYAQRPGYSVDVAVQENNSGKFYITYPDIYINSRNKGDQNQYGVIYNGGNGVNTADDNAILNHVDESDSLPAYNVWKSYLDTVRDGKEGRNFCSLLTSDEVKAFLVSYKALSEGAQKIVCASDDFERNGAGDAYSRSVEVFHANDTYNLARTIAYFAELNNVSVTVYNNAIASRYGTEIDAESANFVVISAVLVAISFCVFALLLAKKRKMRGIK